MTVFGICEKGRYRNENQDAVLLRGRGRSGLFIVADGVGSSMAGAKASNQIAREYGQWWDDVFLKSDDKSFFELFEQIKNLAEQINGRLCQSYGAGTTCSTIVLLFIHKGIYGYLSSGDSRIYHCGIRGPRLITRDDVWENRPDGDVHSRHAGKIISAIGGYKQLEYSCATARVRFGEIFLLCSDGIYKYVEEKVLFSSMKKMYRNFLLKESIFNQLVKRAIDNDTKDNYSLVVLKV